MMRSYMLSEQLKKPFVNGEALIDGVITPVAGLSVDDVHQYIAGIVVEGSNTHFTLFSYNDMVKINIIMTDQCSRLCYRTGIILADVDYIDELDECVSQHADSIKSLDVRVIDALHKAVLWHYKERARIRQEAANVFAQHLSD